MLSGGDTDIVDEGEGDAEGTTAFAKDTLTPKRPPLLQSIHAFAL